MSEQLSYINLVMGQVEDLIEQVKKKTADNLVNGSGYDRNSIRWVNDDQAQRADGICSMYYNEVRLGLIKIVVTQPDGIYNLTVVFDPEQ